MNLLNKLPLKTATATTAAQIYAGKVPRYAESANGMRLFPMVNIAGRLVNGGLNGMLGKG